MKIYIVMPTQPLKWKDITGYIQVSSTKTKSSEQIAALFRVDASWFEMLDSTPTRRGLTLNKKGMANIRKAIPLFNTQDYAWKFLSSVEFERKRRTLQSLITQYQRLLNFSNQRW